MPQHDPNDPSATGRPPFGGDAESIDDEDFWERARRTKKEDKKASRRIGRKASSSRKRKTPPRSGEQVSFGLPPTGGAKGGTDYPVSPRVARARRQLQGLPPEPGPEPEMPPPGRGGGGFRDRLTGRQQPVGPPPEPPRQPIPMPPPTAPSPQVRPAAHGSPPSPLSRPAPGPPTAPSPQVPPPTGPGTPPLMSPLLAKSRLAGRRAQRSGLTGQTPAVPGPPGSPGPAGAPPLGGPGGRGAPGAPGPVGSPGAPDRSLRRPPPLSGRSGPPTGETPLVPPPSPSTRGRRLAGAAGAGATDPRTPPGGLVDGRPPSLPPRAAPRRSVGAPPSPRSGDPDLLVSPPRDTSAGGPLPSSRRRTGAAPPLSPPAGTPAWDPASTASTPGVGRSGRGGRLGRTGAGAGAEGLGTAAGGGAAGRRPGPNDPGATGKMPRTSYPATGRTPTGPTGVTRDNGPMLNATQQSPVTGGRLRRPTTGSNPLVAPNTGGTLGPISAELPVVEPGPIAGVEPSPWEPPPVPRAGARPTEPRVGRRSGEVPVLDDRFDDRFDDYAPRSVPPRDPQPVTTQVDLDTGLDRGFDRPPPSPGPGLVPAPGPAPDRALRNQGTAAGSAPGTMTRRAPYDDGFDDRDHDDYHDDDFDDRDEDFDGSERPGCGRFAVPLAVVAAVLCIVLVATVVWARRQIDPGGAPGPAVSVDIESGQSTSDIGKALEDADVITSASVWTWYVRLRGGGDVQAGTYELHENMSMGDALDALTSGPLPPDARAVTVSEGLSTNQLVSKLTSGEGAVKGFTAERLQAALADPAMRSEILPADEPNIEGTLFPETYNIAEDATEAELIQKMVDQFDAVTTDLDLVGGAEALGYSPYEVLIVASLVEEEAKFDDERPKVARVIYNRLGRNEALGIDATSCYNKPEGQCRVGDGSAYDTRERVGLPPTPISSPGRASINAALHPADGPWRYYVRNDGEGHHMFTDDYNAFLAAKQTCVDNNWGCG